MTEEQIEKEFIKTLSIPKMTIVDMESPRQDLTFNEFKTIIMYKGLHFKEESFIQNYNFYNSTNKYNYLAYLLSDQNSISIKVCKFKGTTKVDFLSRKEFSDGCILRKMEEAYDYADNIINLIQTDISNGKNRIDTALYDREVFKEAWYNAICHNLWTSKIPPAIYGFEDRVEIISQGTLRDDLTQEDFFNSVSKPVNQELANIFLKLNYMEQSGKGISTIISKYDKSVFYFGSSFIQCILPFNIVDKEKYYQIIGKEHNVHQNVHQKSYLEKITYLIKNNKNITLNEMSLEVGMSVKTVQRAIKKTGKIKYVGSSKSGHWEITND